MEGEQQIINESNDDNGYEEKMENNREIWRTLDNEGEHDNEEEHQIMMKKNGE